jgi:Ca2+-binding RTX toxin-like protein
MEIFEDRRVLACDVFNPDDLFGDNGVLHQLQQTIDNAAFVAQQIPLVGDQLSDTLPFGLEIRQELMDVYDSAEGAIQDRVQSTLSNVLGDTNHAFLDQMIDVQFDSEACEASLTVDLSRTLASWELPGLDFDFGLQSLPFYVDANVGGIEFQMGFDLTPFAINLDLDSGDVTLDTNNTSLSLEVTAGLADGAQINAQIGFLRMSLSDGLGESPADDERSHLTFGVDIDFGPNFSINQTELTGNAELLLHLQSEVNEYLPSIGADFILQYDFTSGDAPEARFENVSIGLGDLATKLLNPIVEILEPVIEPISAVTGLLTNPIPVISDLGLGDVSVMDIANGLADAGALPPDYTAYVTLVDVFTQVVGFLDAFESSECTGGDCTDVAINLGNLSISDHNADLRTIDPKTFEPTVQDVSISGLSIGNIADLDGLIDRVEGLTALPGPARDVLVNALQDLDSELSQGASIAFPIISNPAGVVFQWLVGQNADLFTAQANITLGESDVDLSGPLPVGINGGLRGGFSPSVTLDVGYDTFGFRRFLENHRNGVASATDLLDGFYISDDSQLSIKGWLEAYVEFNAAVFSLEASGGIQASLVANVIGSAEDPSLPDEDGEHDKVRFLSEMNACAFSLEGDIGASIALAARLGVQVGPVFIGVEDRWELASFDIASFDLSCVGNPLYQAESDEVTLGEIDDSGVLTLYAGPTANQRSVAPLVTQEIYEILAIPGTSSVQVNAFGVSQVFEDVTHIIADLGGNFDMVTIGQDVLADVTIHGGDGHDILRSFGSGATTFYGDGGQDVLRGGTGDNFLYGGDDDDSLTGVGHVGATIELHGDSGNDTLTGGLGNNQLFGGIGNDYIIGGTGDNWIEGGADDDTLFGGPGNDQLFGQSGQDTISAGTGHATIEGGTGDDAFYVSSGHADVLGGDGDDRLSWDFGDGTVTFDGGTGFDSIGHIGSTSNDTFLLMNHAGAMRVVAPGATTTVATSSVHVEEVSVDGMFGQDRILVQSLAGTSVQRVNINLTDNLARDNVEDLISIHGGPVRDELLVENVDATLVESPTQLPPVIGGVMRISGFRSQPLIVDDHYEIYAMNFDDRILLNTHAGNDEVTVRGITGPTYINTSSGDDAIVVEASMPFNLASETGDFLASLYIDAGAGSNALAVSQAAAITGDDVYVSDRLIQSTFLPAVHYEAQGGGSFGGGIEVTTSNLIDTVHVTSTRRGAVTTVNTGGGVDTILVDSDPIGMDGDLDEIRGRLILNGGSGHTVVTLNDTADTDASPEVAIVAATVNGQNAVLVTGFAGPADDVSIAIIDHANLELELLGSDNAAVPENFSINTTSLGLTRIIDQSGSASYAVERTVGPLQIVGGDGDELVRIAPVSQSWSELLGSVNVQLGAGNDRVEISDQATEELTFYHLDTNSIARGPAFSGTVQFDSQLEVLQLDGASDTDVLNVLALPVVNVVEVNQGTGANTVVGPTTGAIWTLTGADEVAVENQIFVTGASTLASGGGENQFVVQNAGTVSEAIFGTPAGVDVLDYSSYVGPVTIDLNNQTATNIASFNYLDQFIGGGADDLVLGPDDDTTWIVSGSSSGTVQIDGEPAQWSFQSIEQIVGGSGDDHFLMEPIGQMNLISGGHGTDHLNYSFFSSGVVVDLLNQTATNVGTVTLIENATGGAGDDMIWGDGGANELRGQLGHDILIGRTGNDTLFGSFGNDILIGGTGADALHGGHGSDLLIAGNTTYDDAPASLEALRTVWSNTGNSYGRRISSLINAAARTRLSASTVLNDLHVDTLFGDNDLDWFWSGLGDVLADRTADEAVN